MKNFIQKCTICACLIFLSSCISLSKREQTENLIVPPEMGDITAHSLSLSFFSEGDWPSQNWWEIFQSEELNQLMVEAIQTNPTIQSVAKTFEKARAESTIARSLLFPLLYFDYDENYEYLGKNGLYRSLNKDFRANLNLLDFSLSAHYEIDFWGKYRNLFHAAVGRAKAEAAELNQTILLTTTSLAQSFFALKTNLIRKYLYKELYLVRKKLLDLSHLLEEKSLFSKLPPLLSDEVCTESKKLVYAINEEVANDKYLINLLRGKGPDAELSIQATLPPLPPSLVLPKTLSLDLLSRRPDLMAQIWRVEALAHDVGAAKAEFYPNVNLVGLLGLESGGFSNIFQGNSKAFSLAPAVHLPVFTAGAIGAGVRSKKAEFDAAVATYNDLILRSCQEVATVLAFAESIFLQKKSQDRIVLAAAERYEITELRTRSGLDSLLQTYRFQEELILKQLDQVNLLYNQYVAAVRLIKSLGGGFGADETPPLKGDHQP